MGDEDGILSWEDGFKIGCRIAEMADRVKVGHRILPGSQAKWFFDMDGTKFEVVVSVAKEQSNDHPA